MTEKRWLALILILFTGLGITYAIVTPIFEASDELWHYPMVRHLADGNPLPIQVFDPLQAGPWKQEASQPPLYYYLGAALTFWIDTADMEAVRWLNPHVDNGVITEDGNINLIIHDPSLPSWEGVSLAIRIVRLASVFLGSATVYLTYRIAKEVVPTRPEIFLGAAGVNAFIPMFLFISGAVNNDNLVIALSSLALLMIINLGSHPGRHQDRKGEIWKLLLVGVVIGLGALTKISAIGLIPLALIGIAVGQWKSAADSPGVPKYFIILRETLWRFALLLLPVLLIASWWYVRNIQLYGDWSGWNAFIAVLGKRATPAGLAQLWDERLGFMLSFWGLFGGLNVPMADWVYRLLNIMLIVSVIGFVAYFIRMLVVWWTDRRKPGRKIGVIFENIFNFVADNFALIMCVLWSIAVIAGLVRWATVTWSSQGRLIFSSISAISTILIVGLVGWMPSSRAKWVVSAVVGFLFLVSAVAPFFWIKPAYEVVTADASDLRIVNVDFEDSMRLTSYSVDVESAKPGETVEVFTQWDVLQEMDRDWSVFVHMNDPETELPAAQRDMYPGQGLLATRLLSPGDQIIDRYLLKIPETAITPSDLDLTIGLYDFQSGERMSTGDETDSVALSVISLTPHPGDIPNPISIDFEDIFELIGFSVVPRRLAPGESIAVTLYYEPQTEVSEDFTFFVQVVDDDTTRWASQDLIQPTSQWQKGEVQSILFSLSLMDETPAGILPIILGMYTRTDDGGFDRLQRVTSEGRLTDDFLELTKIRID
ncbi:MAG: hypothetical protein WA996_02285 [Candidatus Promineifilaceae bacterium]